MLRTKQLFPPQSADPVFRNAVAFLVQRSLHIALVSFEFPPAIAIGGIGTYTWNAANLLTQAGHSVEIFAAGHRKTEELSTAFHVNRIEVADRDMFRAGVGEPFMARHRTKPFDVVESPEYGAEAAGIHALVPDVPRVVRLHTPHFLTHELNRVSPTALQRLRFTVGALRRGRLGWLKENQCALSERDAVERNNAQNADLIVAPCRSIRDIVCARWNVAPERCAVVPNAFTPALELLSLPPQPATKYVLFLGRLEVRKGILEMAAAVPLVLRRHPDAKFVFVGPPSAIPYRVEDSETYLKSRLRKHLAQCEFVGAQDKSGVAMQLARTDVAVFPSRWENFPNVCLEAMSAGRAVIGSAAGGMADIIEHNVSGILIPPLSPSSIANAVIQLLDAPDQARAMGNAARKRVSDYCSASAVTSLHVGAYVTAIDRGHTRFRHSLPLASSI